MSQPVETSSNTCCPKRVTVSLNGPVTSTSKQIKLTDIRAYIKEQQQTEGGRRWKKCIPLLPITIGYTFDEVCKRHKMADVIKIEFTWRD